MKRLYDVIVHRVFLMLIASILCISSISVFTIYRYILPNMQQLVDNHVKTQVSDINLWFQFNSELIRLYATQFQNEEISSKNKIHLLHKLEEFKEKSNIQYDSLGFITKEGRKYVTDNSSFSVDDRSYFAKLKSSNQDVVISDVIESKSNKNKIILILAKIYDEKHQEKGYISAALKTEYIENLMTNVARDFHAYLKNNKNETVLGNDQFQHTGIHFEKQLYSYLNLTYVLDIPRSYYMNTILLTVVLITLVTMLLLLVTQRVTHHVVHRLVHPIQSLESVMLKTKDGVLEKNEEETEILEFNRLNQKYNQMIDEIHHLLQQVKVKEIERNDANNKAMYAQIKPHFLYNTLETIQAMAFDHEDEDVEKAIHDLAVFFRISLSNDRQIITVQEEIKHAQSYLNIQKLRYQDVLQYSFNIQDFDLERPFLKFTLQPLVENAIYHGIKLLKKKELIVIRVYQRDEDIVMEVENVFEELDFKYIEEINRTLKTGNRLDNQKGYGLFNVNARIKHQYGEKYGVCLIAENNRFISRMVQPGR
ncbi:MULTISPECIES: sensor histidine kinase [Terrabacteria group]|uniref:sensor histidine kinase n=1 Tax=Bacillati TaxID=1783272 RepID=UPI001C6E2412|nr:MULTISPECIES: histidine kinase [Terrabacteria group]MBW9212195.1 histidine kinase [Trueperella sp. zg.1013]